MPPNALAPPAVCNQQFLKRIVWQRFKRPNTPQWCTISLSILSVNCAYLFPITCNMLQQRLSLHFFTPHPTKECGIIKNRRSDSLNSLYTFLFGDATQLLLYFSNQCLLQRLWEVYPLSIALWFSQAGIVSVFFTAFVSLYALMSQTTNVANPSSTLSISDNSDGAVKSPPPSNSVSK